MESFQTFCEADNRRDFLKKLGLGAAVAANPTGALNVVKKLITPEKLFVDWSFRNRIQHAATFFQRGGHSIPLSDAARNILRDSIPVIDMENKAVSLLDKDGNNIFAKIKSDPDLTDEIYEMYLEYLGSIKGVDDEEYQESWPAAHELLGNIMLDLTDNMDSPISFETLANSEILKKSIDKSRIISREIHRIYKLCRYEGILNAFANHPSLKSLSMKYRNADALIGGWLDNEEIYEISDKLLGDIQYLINPKALIFNSKNGSLDTLINQLQSYQPNITNLVSPIVNRAVEYVTDFNRLRNKRKDEDDQIQYHHIEPPQPPNLTPESYNRYSWKTK